MQHKNVYIVGMYDRSITGFATYKEELSACMLTQPDLSVNFINLRCPIPEFRIDEKSGIIIYDCPATKQKPLEVAGALLSLHISDNNNNIFLINFAPSALFVKILRKYFNKGKIVYIIHDFMWALYLWGDINRLKDIIACGKSDKLTPLIKQFYFDGAETFNMSDHVVCLSEDTQQLLENLYKVPKHKLTMIPNGLRDAFDSISYNKKTKLCGAVSTYRTLLYVGRTSEQKGIIDLLECFKMVLKVFPDCKLALIGEIDSKVIGAMDDKIRPNVLLLGEQPKQRVYEWYRIADIGILPSYYEQCSYTGIEMKMFGLPVISSDGFGIRQMFRPSNAIIASIGSRSHRQEFQRNLATAIIKALSLPAERISELKQNSRRDYLDRFNSINTLNKYKCMLEKLSIDRI